MAPTAQRLALVLPESPTLGVAARGLSTAVDSGEILYDLETQVAYVDPRGPQADVDSVAARIRNGGVGLVVALGDGSTAQALATVVRTLPGTRFVFVDASLSELSLEGVPNAAAIRFAEEDVLHLGRISQRTDADHGRIAKSRRPRLGRRRRGRSATPTRLLAGFKRGLRETNPGVTVRVDYSHELEDPTACERLANRQIDEGSDIVVAVSGRCGLGAVEVARIRGVWSVGAEEDGVLERAHVLVSTHKEWTPASLFAIERLVQGALPMGRDTVLGLEDDYAVQLNTSDLIPDEFWSAVVHRCSRIRATRHRDI